MRHPFLFSISDKKVQVRVHSAFRISRLMREVNFNVPLVEIVVLDDARRWNEIWSPMGSLLIIREDVAVAMESAGLRGLRWAEVKILKTTERLADEPAPSYRCLLPEAGIEVDLGKIEFNDRDRTTSTRSDMAAPAETRFVPIRESWNGADFVVCANHSTLYVWCTLRVLELARNLKWKGLRFFPMDVPGAAAVTFNRGAGIDYLGNQWPPQWYPEGITPSPENLESI